jgi:hypothetical protein
MGKAQASQHEASIPTMPIETTGNLAIVVTSETIIARREAIAAMKATTASASLHGTPLAPRRVTAVGIPEETTKETTIGARIGADDLHWIGAASVSCSLAR